MIAEDVSQLSSVYSKFIVDSDDYVIGHVIGGGGFSQIIGSRNKKSGDPAVIKRFFDDSEIDAEKAFATEASVLANLSNQFIIRMHGFTAKKPFDIVLDYYGKGSLNQIFEENEERIELSGTQKTIVALGVASGMKYLHENGILHCDLNTGNILLTDDLDPVIIDFGIATTVGQAKMQEFGTPQWIAPEVLGGHPPTFKSDVYSYGILLWSLLTCEYPFKDENSIKVFIDIAKRHKKIQIPPDTPKALTELIKSCIHFDPDHRPSFDDIYAKLSSGKVEMPDTNRKQVIQYMESKGLPQIEPAFKKRIRTTNHPDFKEFPISLLSTLSSSSSNFPALISRITACVNPQNIDMFFQAISPILDEWDDGIAHILSACNALFSIDSKYTRSFINLGLINKLKFDDYSVLPYVCEAAIYVLSTDPSIATKDMIDSFAEIIPDYPKYALRLFNIYTCHIPMLPYFEYSAELILSKFGLFVNKGETTNALALLYTICSINTQFKEKHIEKITSILGQTIKLKDNPSVKISYEFITSEMPEFVADSSLIESQILEPVLQPAILGYIATSKLFVPSQNLAMLILKLAEANQYANTALLYLCQRKENAIVVAHASGQWLSKGLPTIETKIKLGFIVLKFEEARKIIYNYPLAFFEFLKHVAEKLLPSIPILFNSLKFPQSLLNSLGDNGFFTYYFDLVIKSGSSKNACASLTFLEGLVQKFQHKDLYGAVPLINALIDTQNDGWAPYVMSALISLSTIHEIALRLRLDGFPHRVRGWGLLNSCFSLYEALDMLLK